MRSNEPTRSATPQFADKALPSQASCNKVLGWLTKPSSIAALASSKSGLITRVLREFILDIVASDWPNEECYETPRRTFVFPDQQVKPIAIETS
jgi:hypothetical protein